MSGGRTLEHAPRRREENSMPLYVMLTRLSAQGAPSARSYEDLEHAVEEGIQAHCPQVAWRGSYAVLGPHDYIDLFEAPDNDTAFKVAAIVRTTGHAYTEVWPASDWQRFKGLMRDVSAEAHP